MTAVRFAFIVMAWLLSWEKSMKAMSVPCPMNRVSLPARNDGSSDVRLVRSTTTSNEPLAAS